MPETQTLTFLGNDQFDPTEYGYTWSDYYEAWVPSDEVVETDNDGYIHHEHVAICLICSASVCHVDNEDENFNHVVDRDSLWCNDCIENHAEWVDAREGVLEGYYAEAPEEEEEESEPLPPPIPGYHSNRRSIARGDRATPFRIGLEIEKEDGDLRSALSSGAMLLPPGWLFERDGSLDDRTGIEVITRAYNLSEIDVLKADFKKAEKVFDAKFSKACGGHISISDARYTPIELSKRIKPLFPLLMALYPKRLTAEYAKPMKDKEKGMKDRHHAFSFGPEDRGQRIELRVPSAVRSLKTALWRVELVSYFLLKSQEKSLTWDFMRDELREDGHVKKLLMKAYNRPGIDHAEKKVRQVLFMYKAFRGWYYNDKAPKDCIAEYLGQFHQIHLHPRVDGDYDPAIAPRNTRYWGTYNRNCGCRDCVRIAANAPNERIREVQLMAQRAEDEARRAEIRARDTRIMNYDDTRTEQYYQEAHEIEVSTPRGSVRDELLAAARARRIADINREHEAAEAEMQADRAARLAAAAPTTPAASTDDQIF